jgi:transposase
MRTDLKSLRITRTEIEGLLVSETRPNIRKRLLGVHAVLCGETYDAAARIAGVGTASIIRWMRWSRKHGAAALLRNGRAPLMTAEQMAAVRQEIEAALVGPLPHRTRQCLAAIQLALAGRTGEAAKRAGVHQVTINRWLREFWSKGIRPFLHRYEKAAQDFDAHLAQLHALANGEKNPNIRKRILAVAYVAAGVPVRDAAISAGLALDTVYVALHRLRKEGVNAFCNKPIAGRPVRLAPDQLETVAAMVRDNPAITAHDLCARIRADFGIRYTPAGLKNMLKKQLGILCGGAASRSVPSAHPLPSKT